jgi:hypothetical protein
MLTIIIIWLISLKVAGLWDVKDPTLFSIHNLLLERQFVTKSTFLDCYYPE